MFFFTFRFVIDKCDEILDKTHRMIHIFTRLMILWVLVFWEIAYWELDRTLIILTFFYQKKKKKAGSKKGIVKTINSDKKNLKKSTE